ncbi:hypothetical protein HMPREF1022_03304 [Desulfovibrio sp. 6_1_46AFAA]|uniref:phage antirepressor KilAC domain-containing protein n=1 Tax=Desulfovibrio sp. 6_1_46AFAA TaxID=665942 RepID=UPI00022373C2|nr:phage antirepressor KilAC domain-containing protein [Desulfovibrio sp. 6_1_46AFAA]EGW49675.1 hypothetical protein HMPREF1022_03304 [Desulfovibrio sp. 6_1_46AFAA]
MSSTIIIDSVSGPTPSTPYPGLEPAYAASAPALFTFPETGQRVRVVEGPDEEPWFVARDVCDCLELADTNKALLGLDHDEKCEHENYSCSGRRPLIISEPGLYSLILRSRKPQARTFKRWITHDVLPALRRTGHYSMSAPSSASTAVDADLARLMLDRLTIIEQQIAPLKEKAGRFDAFLSVDGTASLTEAAKMLGMTAISLAKLLRGDALRWLFKKNGSNAGPNIPTAEVIRNGWMVLKAARSPYDGRLHSSARFTAKGLDALYGIIEEMKESLTPVNKAIYEA